MRTCKRVQSFIPRATSSTWDSPLEPNQHVSSLEMSGFNRVAFPFRSPFLIDNHKDYTVKKYTKNQQQKS